MSHTGKDVQGQQGDATSSTSSQTVYLNEEINTFARLINKELSDVEQVKDKLPIAIDKPTDFFDLLSDGLIVIFLFDKISLGSLDMTTIKVGTNLKPFEIIDNLNIFFAGCKDLI